jgi:hypothetical protein
MPRPRTGHPVGRPTTYTTDEERPVTRSLRIPRDLDDQLTRYAARHRQGITELLLDGLRLRLEQDDPRYAALSSEQYYDNTVFQELAIPVHLLDDRIPFDEDGRSAPAGPTPDISYDNNTVIQQLGVSDVEVPGRTDSSAPRPAPDYDHTKYILSEKLCSGGHDYQGTGRTLLSIQGRKCTQCQTAQQRQRREAKRQTAHV